MTPVSKAPTATINQLTINSPRSEPAEHWPQIVLA
jgi:hypothetical protein